MAGKMKGLERQIKKARAMRLRALGYYEEQIAERLDVSGSTINRWRKEVKEEFEEDGIPLWYHYVGMLETFVDSKQEKKEERG